VPRHAVARDHAGQRDATRISDARVRDVKVPCRQLRRASVFKARWPNAADFATFIAAILFRVRIPSERMVPADVPAERPHLLANLTEGLRFAWMRAVVIAATVWALGTMALDFADGALNHRCFGDCPDYARVTVGNWPPHCGQCARSIQVG
jgi:hypothetical protein